MKKFILLLALTLLVSCNREPPSGWILTDGNGKEYRLDQHPKLTSTSGVAYCKIRGEYRLFKNWQEIREVKQ